MSVHEPFEDETLGHVTFDTEHGEWKFTVTISRREVSGSIVPEDKLLPLQEQGLEEICRCVGWIRDNEPSIRQYITEQMFDGWLEGWYDEEIDEISTPAEFQEAISLSGIWVVEDRSAILFYDDGGLFGGHCIDLRVESSGQYRHSPNISG